MSNWIRLNTDELNSPRKEKVRGVDVEVFVSPYDLPEAVSGEYDATIKRFVIEFKYITSGEKQVVGGDAENMRLLVGENSGRLYRVEVDVNALRASRINLIVLPGKVDEAIDHLAARKQRKASQGNYRIAKQVITQKRDQLFRQLSAAE
jgi:hypothetical protein